MNNEGGGGKSIAELLANHELITATIQRAVLQHARAGRSVAAWRDGRVVLVPPHEVFALFANEARATKSDLLPNIKPGVCLPP